MRSPQECNNDVALGSLVQEHFRVTRDHNLATLSSSGVCQHLIDLSLTKYLQMSIRLVYQQYRADMKAEVTQEEQGLLQAAT